MFTATLILLVSAFLPWGVVDLRKMFESLTAGNGAGEGISQLIAAIGVVPVSAWNGHASMFGLKVPNFVVPACGLAVTIIVWVKLLSGYYRPGIASSLLAAYGFVHSGWLWIDLATSAEGSPRIGVMLSTLAFGWMLIALLVCREWRGGQPLPSAAEPAAQTGSPPNQ
jgi:hypothetical protein